MRSKNLIACILLLLFSITVWARKVQKYLSHPMHVSEVFSGIPGTYVPVSETIKGFAMILDGKLDYVNENDFSYKGTIEEVLESYEKNKGK